MGCFQQPPISPRRKRLTTMVVLPLEISLSVQKANTVKNNKVNEYAQLNQKVQN